MRLKWIYPLGLTLLTFTSCLSESSTPEISDPYASDRNQALAKINQFRALEGKAPLTLNTSQNACANLQAEKDSQTQKAHSAFGDCKEMAQNECPGWSSVSSTTESCLQMMWDEGPGEPYSAHGHYINMSSTSYTQVSIGYYQTSTGKVWAIYNFYK